MATAFADDFEDFTTCGVCFCEYDDLNRKPKFLHCNARHTVCVSCLKRINQNSTISCPFCRENFSSADVASLPNNVYVLHMLKFKDQKVENMVEKPTITNGKIPNPLTTRVCPTCGSGIKNEGINSLATAIEKQKESQKQLDVILKSIQVAEKEVKKLQEENDLKLVKMVSVVEVKSPKTTIPASVSTDKFVLNGGSVFILRMFQSGKLKGDIHFSPYLSSATKHFLKMLGEFCYKSPKYFNSTVDKAIAGCFVLLSVDHPEFQPATTDISRFSVKEARDYGEIGITLITSAKNKVTGWSFVFVLEENQSFMGRNNLPEYVPNSELIGRVLQKLQLMTVLSRVSKSARSDYAFTLESRS